MVTRPLTVGEMQALKQEILTPKDIGNWTHYILLTNGVKMGVNPNTYPFASEHRKYFHRNTDEAAHA